MAVCAAIEAEIADLDDADKTEFLADLGMTEPGLNRVIRAGYSLLGLQTCRRREFSRIFASVFICVYIWILD